MHFTIITEGLPFSGDTLKHSSLGGSETAVIEVARNIAKQGHEVDVFCNCDNEGKFEGVRYNHITKYVDFIKGGFTDVCIVSRFSQYLTFGKIPSKVNVLWCHDIIDDNSKDMMMSATWAVDYMYCLTDYHKWQYTNVLPDLEPIIKLTSNGIDRSLIKKEKKLHRIMFTSRPERGLMKALDLYEQLGDKSLEMLVCNYKTLDVEQVRQIEGMARRRIDDLLAKGFNVTEGRFTKEKLYKEISKSKAVIYPTAFPEIFCISAVEAQANGTVYITTDDFAMLETVGYKGVELNEDYDKNFLAIMKGIIYDDEARQQFEKLGKEHVKKYTWENVAKQFIDDASKFMAKRFENNKEACYKRMIHESNYVLLREYLEKYEPDHKLLEQLNHDLRFVDGKADYKSLYENEETHAKIDTDYEINKLNARFKWFGTTIGDNKTVLDFACHTGGNTIANAERYPDVKFTGYDISVKAIKKAKATAKARGVKNVEFTSDISELKTYDMIWAGEYLEHCLDIKAEVLRLEKYATKKVCVSIPKGAWESLSAKANKELDVVYHVHGFTTLDVKKMFGNQKDYMFNLIDFGMRDAYNYCLGNFLISYTPTGTPINDRDCKEIVETVRPYQSISACIIAKNAEYTIEKMLSSIEKYVDEIIVADDNSTDTTAKRAEAFGAKVVKMPKSICSPDYWGFANARNFSIEHATGQWILWIDTDEVAFKLDKLKQHIEGELINAFVIPQMHSMLDSFTPPEKPQRLFRKSAGKFFGYIHEQVQSPEDYNTPVKPALVMRDACMVNYGSATEQDRRYKAIERNLPLLEKDWAENVEGKENYRKITPYYVARDWFNRAVWQFDEFKSFNTPEVQKNIIPKLLQLKKKYYDPETDQTFRDSWDKLLQQIYKTLKLGTDVDMIIDGKELKKRYLSLEELVEDVKKL